ncbi:Maltose ABC superfamily ATP binding cassette transporter, maltose-binding protein [Lactobacillus equicursoris DSM 19284 = JCM 14600 = CIP 110162]|uniref:Maltose ABC transporter permease n=2 Tax=Lactobacillus equicursoris TaxID=420645 RepID=K0NLH7_9LACO|nr:extracellular solute-binding protein [Lactobacillus equicursoris]KRL01890.1 maltose ABC transporter permease [Lactobacillus equicursoris DSM 19284 = JCM 14600 = CIP 110162]CCK84544.1 Maltose ABC superfamily ATP binding cassette transporter, maltose-binding protein [Lactobacillus equicursoris 66c]CCK86207.1 Maltose ABC superfamily ATP binding cassette transporter, maltose-binding protein [Lactobacillus equicursoris DSM 19284 = JCM 14600 = CIP 110162]
MSFFKKAALGSAAVLAALSLSACSNSSNSSSSSSSEKKASLTLWVDTEQVSYYKSIVKDFHKKHPNITVKVTQSPNGSANAKTDVGKDASKAADVFEVPNDQLGQMANAGYINPLSPSDTSNIKKNYVSQAAKGVTWKGKIYAYPYAQQADTIYYNKSKLSASDVKDWDTLTKKGVLATDFTNAYTMWPVFFSAGTTLYGENGEDLKGSTFNSQNGVNALTWIAKQKSNKNVMQTSNALNQLKKGNAAAIMDGPWNAANIKKILGKNFAVAKYPTVTVGGKKVQLEAFLGIEGFAVNSHTSNAKASSELAAYITNKKSQLIAHDKAGQIPVLKSAVASSDVKSDPVAVAVIEMAKSGNSVLQPKLPQMATFWDGAAPLVSGAYDGKIKPSQYKAQLAKFAKKISQK